MQLSSSDPTRAFEVEKAQLVRIQIGVDRLAKKKIHVLCLRFELVDIPFGK